MKYNNMILLGSGWGYDAAYKGLIKTFTNLKTSEDLNLPIDNKGRYILDDLKNNLIIFSGYKPIIPNNVLLNNKCINIHYSLLPQYRGLHSVVWAILNDEEYLGLSIHEMNEYIDDGDIIYQFSVLNDKIRTSTEYIEMFNQYISENLGNIMFRYINGEIKPFPQNKRFASWVGKRDIFDCRIDFEKSIDYQKRFFRALTKPYPLPWVSCRGIRYYISNVDFYNNRVETHNGRILNIDNEGIWVKCKDGYIIFRQMIDENDNVIDNINFHIGQKLD